MAGPRLGQRLTATDAAFLYWEKPNQPLHIGSVNVYDGHLSRSDLVGVLSGRMHLLARYRQRAVFPPFGLTHPMWEDDPALDLANHVDEMEIPSPGDDRALSVA